ncbi:AraC family transcriptional regulator [Sphingobium sp. AS12]|uniref:helix-turn-helix domain-containing protein n=1 Tax=Sphingobium sp. AS12 TaxID=2849495 RepID=UPI001C31337C|nr:AraC family transcriptional regulator [Sphingobium sp. AS12]MBV2150025.1 AraC family transcriptional regulator [Sphingobium sp. AS12]
MEEMAIDLDVLSVSGPEATISSGGARLAPWQIKVAKQGMARQLRTGLRIGEVAARLELSETHFAKAFRNSVGVAPYRWFQNARIAYAMRMLAEPHLSLSEIAAECGYSDQSHFITAFSRAIGTTPGRWRRKRRSATNTEPLGRAAA